MSKGALDVDGAGSKLIEQLVDRGLVASIADLYRLDGALLASLERMGEKSATNLVAALAASKRQPWHRQLYGLGIHHVGEVNAKALARVFPSVAELAAAAPSGPRRSLRCSASAVKSPRACGSGLPRRPTVPCWRRSTTGVFPCG